MHFLMVLLFNFLKYMQNLSEPSYFLAVELVERSQASTTYTELSLQLTDFSDTLIGCADKLHIRTGIREVYPS